jgi:hypothetical protein
MNSSLKPPSTVYNFEGMGGSTKTIRRYAEEDNENWSAFNPSIGYSEKDGYICLFRSSNYIYTEQGIIRVLAGNEIKNKVYVGKFDKDFNLVDVRMVTFIGGLSQNRGSEDPKLYIRDGEWYFHAIMQEREHTPVQRVATFKFNLEKAEAYFIKKYESYDYSLVEKNWAKPFYEDNKNFDFVYSSTGIYTEGRFLMKESTDTRLSRLRGGTNLWPLGDGTYLGVSHKQYRKPLKNIYVQELDKVMNNFLRAYTHCFVRYDSFGSVIEISDEFVLDDFQLEFVSGLIEKDENFMVSYGVNDNEAKIGFLPKQTVLQMLNPLGENDD